MKNNVIIILDYFQNNYFKKERLTIKYYYKTNIVPGEETSPTKKSEMKAESRRKYEHGMMDSEVDSKFGYEFTDGNMNTRTIFVRLTRYVLNE